MRGFRGKLITFLVIYFAGFATAVYVIVPPQDQSQQVQIVREDGDNQFKIPNFNTEEFIFSFRRGMDKCIAFGKSAAIEVGHMVKEKYESTYDTKESQ